MEALEVIPERMDLLSIIKTVEITAILVHKLTNTQVQLTAAI
jgi:hypothetical protein